MNKGDCIYLKVMVQMILKGWDNQALAEKAGMSYTSICRKLRGISPLYLEEARRIQQALNCGLTLDKLFEEKRKQE